MTNQALAKTPEIGTTVGVSCLYSVVREIAESARGRRFSDQEPLIVRVLDIYSKVFLIGSLVIVCWRFLAGNAGMNPATSYLFSIVTSVFSPFVVIALVVVIRILLRIEALLERNRKRE